MFKIILILGGSVRTDHFDDILEWDPAQNAWTMRGNMAVERAFHAASYVEFDEKFCLS